MIRAPRPRNPSPRRSLRRILHDTRGATAIEYGLILALVALAVIGSIIAVAQQTTDMWGNINTRVTSAR